MATYKPSEEPGSSEGWGKRNLYDFSFTKNLFMRLFEKSGLSEKYPTFRGISLFSRFGTTTTITYFAKA